MTLTILSLEDEADVRDALERDLEQFWDKIRLEVAEDVDDAPTGAEQADVGGYTSPSAVPGPGDPLDDARPVAAVSPEAPPPPHTAPDGGTPRSSRAPGFTEDSDRRQQP